MRPDIVYRDRDPGLSSKDALEPAVREALAAGPESIREEAGVYVLTGNGYELFAASEAPETPPDYGVLVIEARRTSEAALTFLRSLADLPPMPLWR